MKEKDVENSLYDLGPDGVESKVYFQPGDIVTVSKKLDNKPIMMVLRKKSYTIKDSITDNKLLLGIECGWFNKNQDFCTRTFSTKDLQKV